MREGGGVGDGRIEGECRYVREGGGVGNGRIEGECRHEGRGWAGAAAGATGDGARGLQREGVREHARREGTRAAKEYGWVSTPACVCVSVHWCGWHALHVGGSHTHLLLRKGRLVLKGVQDQWNKLREVRTNLLRAHVGQLTQGGQHTGRDA